MGQTSISSVMVPLRSYSFTPSSHPPEAVWHHLQQLHTYVHLRPTTLPYISSVRVLVTFRASQPEAREFLSDALSDTDPWHVLPASPAEFWLYLYTSSTYIHGFESNGYPWTASANLQCRWVLSVLQTWYLPPSQFASLASLSTYP
jgi:hypothetical protein